MRALLLTVALVVMVPGLGQAADVVINNGSAPPDPNNVIDDDRYRYDSVFVRNAGCPPAWPSGNPADPCLSPGSPTEVELADGGLLQWESIYVHDSSVIRMTGGTFWDGGLRLSGSAMAFIGGGSTNSPTQASDSVSIEMTGGFMTGLSMQNSVTAVLTGGEIGGALLMGHSCTVTLAGTRVRGFLWTRDLGEVMMAGGAVDEWVEAYGSSSVAVVGGSIGMELRAYESSNITVAGAGFEVDSVPVPYGELVATTGSLTGALASGDSIDVVFYHGGASCWTEVCTGTITLVPGTDTDGDLIPDALDNCPSIPNGPNQDNQADQDGDDVGDVCDNCPMHYNPRAAYPPYRTTTGGQLDDDADGYGNRCHCAGTLGPICTTLDIVHYKTAISRPVTATNCGITGLLACDRFDYDGRSPVITALDTIVLKELLNKPKGPKCAACPLECVGDACP